MYKNPSIRVDSLSKRYFDNESALGLQEKRAQPGFKVDMNTWTEEELRKMTSSSNLR